MSRTRERGKGRKWARHELSSGEKAEWPTRVVKLLQYSVRVLFKLPFLFLKVKVTTFPLYNGKQHKQAKASR